MTTADDGLALTPLLISPLSKFLTLAIIQPRGTYSVSPLTSHRSIKLNLSKNHNHVISLLHPQSRSCSLVLMVSHCSHSTPSLQSPGHPDSGSHPSNCIRLVSPSVPSQILRRQALYLGHVALYLPESEMASLHFPPQASSRVNCSPVFSRLIFPYRLSSNKIFLSHHWAPLCLPHQV